MKIRNVMAAIAAAFFVATGNAAAATITWSVSLLMNDGGTGSGSFTIDSSTQVVSNVDITTTPGGWPYTTHYVCSSCTYFIDYFIFTPTHISFSIPAVDGRLEFFLSSGSLLSAAALIDVYVLEGHDNPTEGGTDLRDAHGTISAPVPQVPLPGALPLFATGLGALGLIGWRRKRQA